jgi:multiple sugar transport system substrate-binding protein
MGFGINPIRGVRAWRRGLLVGLAAALLAACGGGITAGGGGGTPTLNWYIFHEPSGSFATAAANCSASSGGEYNIQIRELPSAADGQREQLVRRSAARSSRTP